jgi:GTP-binding protein
MIDQIKIFVASGNGGDGIVAFRREKFVPQGGPAGGDGGRGGDVVVRVNEKMNTLSPLANRIHFKASHGGRGGASKKTGKSADPVYIDVPPGTIVRDAETNELLADLVHPGDSVVAAPGGRGGRGNWHFPTASNQAPRFAEKGEPGLERWLLLELRLIADIGIVGAPNAGKSTLLSVVSKARPKIADYPFTTLEPNLGVIEYDGRTLVWADIPGLVEGAHMGVGLGHSFLRHVTRTRAIIHLLSGLSEDPLADYNQINQELALYDERLGQRPQLVVFNKIDQPEAQAKWPAVEAALKARGVQPIAISAATHEGVQQLVRQTFALVDALPPEQLAAPDDEMPVYELPPEEIPFTVEQVGEGEFRVSGKRIERAAAMTYWDYEEAVQRFQNTLEMLGVFNELRKLGIEEGDIVHIAGHELEWSD